MIKSVEICLVLFFAFICNLSSSNLLAAGNDPRVYCGIYSIYGAVSAVLAEDGLSITRPFDDLLTVEYLPSFKGSSSRELEEAAKYLGVNAKTYRLLSWNSLRASKSPLVLHVSSRGRPGKFSHWILFLGIQEGRAIVKDGLGGAFAMERPDLLSRWDGIAIAVFNAKQNPPSFTYFEIAWVCATLGVVGGILFIASFIRRLFFSFAMVSEIGVFVAGLIVGCFVFFASPIVSRIQPPFSTAIAYDIQVLSFTSVERAEVMQILEKNKNFSVVFDCRFKDDYKSGHLPSAVSCPIDISTADLRQKTANLNRNTYFTLYCQSSGCRFSDLVGSELMRLGFRNIRVYREGMEGWQNANGKVSVD